MQLKSWHIALMSFLIPFLGGSILIGINILNTISRPGYYTDTPDFSVLIVIIGILSSFILLIPVILLYFNKTRKIGSIISIIFGILLVSWLIVGTIGDLYTYSIVYGPHHTYVGNDEYSNPKYIYDKDVPGFLFKSFIVIMPAYIYVLSYFSGNKIRKIGSILSIILGILYTAFYGYIFSYMTAGILLIMAGIHGKKFNL